MPLAVSFTRRAAREIAAAQAWWEANRPAAHGAIRIDLGQVLLLLTAQPMIGSIAKSSRLSGVRRLHLDRVNYDLYYRLTPAGIQVLAFWHSRRRSGPDI